MKTLILSCIAAVTLALLSGCATNPNNNANTISMTPAQANAVVLPLGGTQAHD